MKLVTEFFDLSEAESTSNRMRRAGVMTVVTSKKSHILSPARTGALKIGLWAVLDEQYHDAVQLLQHHDHKPKRRISSSEMEKIQKLANIQIRARLKKFFEISAFLIFVGILLVLILFVGFGLINDA